tara:strand:+ start:1216 stop:2730 length:1515 start_codon:yes stop_codon:yes gene_type:complete
MATSCLAMVLACASSESQAGDVHWNQFRGPNGSGVVNVFNPPIKFDPEKPAWNTPIPPAHSSPVVWADRVFLTGVDEGRLATLSLDARTGKILWKRLAPKVELARTHRASSNAASTPCADAERVWVYFGSYGLICYDHDGEEQWTKSIPTPQSMYGMSTSPILHEGKLILLLDNDRNLKGSRLSQSKLIALNSKTGERVWETARPYSRSSWSTPVIWKHDKGIEIAVLGNGRAYGYDASSGEERWYVNGFSRETIAVPVIGNGRLHLSASRQGGWGDSEVDPLPFWNAVLPFDTNKDGRIGRDEMSKDFTVPFRPELPIGHPGFGMPLPADPKRRKQRQHALFNWRDTNRDGFWTKEEFMTDMKVGRGQPNLAAINSGGRGNITESHGAWNLRRGIPEVPSPIFHENRVYLIRAGGILTCVKAEDGEIVYRERMGAPGQYSASPVIARDHLYLVSDRGTLTVIKAGDAFEVVHQTKLGIPVSGTPALDGVTIYIRTREGLLAFR